MTLALNDIRKWRSSWPLASPHTGPPPRILLFRHHARPTTKDTVCQRPTTTTAGHVNTSNSLSIGDSRRQCHANADKTGKVISALHVCATFSQNLLHMDVEQRCSRCPWSENTRQNQCYVYWEDKNGCERLPNGLHFRAVADQKMDWRIMAYFLGWLSATLEHWARRIWAVFYTNLNDHAFTSILTDPNQASDKRTYTVKFTQTLATEMSTTLCIWNFCITSGLLIRLLPSVLLSVVTYVLHDWSTTDSVLEKGILCSGNMVIRML